MRGRIVSQPVGVRKLGALVYRASMRKKDKPVENTEALASVNQKIVADGETLPAVFLKDGTRVQTGTVATLLYNIQRYNAGERVAVEDEIRLAIPTLFKVGLFDLFTLDEWIAGSNAGRTFVGEEAVRYRVQLHANELG